MNLRLELTNVRDGGRAPARSFEFESGPVTVGRSAQCRVLIEGDMISRTHLVLDLLHGTWQATHQGSLTPTLLNNAPIPHGQPRRLNDGDVLTIGDYTMRATYGRDTILPDLQPMRESSADMTINPANAMTQVASSAQATFVGSAPTMHGGVAAPGPAGRVVPSLFVLGAEGGKLELREVERPYVIGRAAGCDLMVQNSSVSRRHAIVRYDGNRIYVRDAGARNPLRINGRPIFGESPLSHGDVLGVGPVDLRVATEAEAPNRAPPTAPSAAPAGGQAPANPSWAAAAAVDAPPSRSVEPPSAPVDSPRWDQVAQSGAAPAWSSSPAAPPRAAAAPSPAPLPPPSPAPAAAPADWSAMAAPPPRAPAPAPTWNVPAAPSAPAAPPPPAWDIPAAPGASAPPPAAPAWNPPPPVAAPLPPAPAPAQFAAPPPTAIPEAAPPPRAERAPAGGGLGSAPKVVARRASSHKGWLVAGVICMLVALGSGIVLIVVASSKG